MADTAKERIINRLEEIMVAGGTVLNRGWADGYVCAMIEAIAIVREELED